MLSWQSQEGVEQLELERPRLLDQGGAVMTIIALLQWHESLNEGFNFLRILAVVPHA